MSARATPIELLRGRRELVVAVLIGLCCFLIFNANGRAISAGDTYPARYLPFAIWHDHTLRLDSIEAITAQGRGNTAFWIEHTRDGHAISLYPVVTPVLLAPLYLPAVAYLNLRGWTDPRLDHLARIMEKLCASGLAALSAALLYLLLRRRASERNAGLLTLAYAFGTTTWVISSQALWQHGMAQVLVIGALLFLTGPCTPRRALAAGMLCGLIAGNRPPDAILAGVLGVYALFWSRHRAPLFVAAAALPAGLVLLYNLGIAGHFAGAYGLEGKAGFLQHDLFRGIAGMLFSPTRGLFVFSPFLLFLAFAWRFRPRDSSERRLTLAMVAGAALQLLLYAKSDWRAGLSWGPRYMTDLLPFLVWMLVPVVTSLRAPGRIAFLFAVSVAILIQAVGAFWYTGDTDLPLFAVTGGPAQMQAAWNWRNAPFIVSLESSPAPRELLLSVRGNFDSVDADGHSVEVATLGEQLSARGWALAGHAKPSHVELLIDGWQTLGTADFVDRGPDPSTWRIPLTAACLAPGEHHLTAMAWASDKGEGHYLGHRTLDVHLASTAAPLASPVARAIGDERPSGERSMPEVHGSFEAVSVVGQPVHTVTAGTELMATGWALAGSATPSQVAVLVDCRRSFTTRTFLDRPDVRSVFHTERPAGWEVRLDTAELPAGEHRLTAFAWAFENGGVRYLGDQKVTVRAPPADLSDLDASVRTAEQRLRENQQKEGYWLTAHTQTTLFEAPEDELNTFLTALMLDVLGPLERAGRLGDSLARARHHLSDQIEPSGLVRYHGLPTGPGIGTLGCAITPDADDTALVWRLAPSRELRRRSSALATLERYRTQDGLYRTWLAPRAAYQCIDPGVDPNPADIAIQMHVLLLLAEANPPAGRALCDALQSAVDEDRHWVYYRQTPLVPMLRLADLRRAGCELALPEARMRSAVPGQEPWVTLARLLDRTQRSTPSPDDAAEIRALLRKVAKDDFVLLRQSPPLLYQNDSSAAVRRFYWSQDIGYALWLRLHHEHAHLRHPPPGD